MLDRNRHILLVSPLDGDTSVFTQMFENHPDKIKLTVADTLPDTADEYGFILSRNSVHSKHETVHILPSSPIRIGTYMDLIESHLIRATQMRDITYGDYHLNADQALLTHKERAIDLTDTETSIIYSLMRAGAGGLKRDDMLTSIWQYRPDLETHTLETHIYRLRQKIEADPGNPKCLVTISNGYMLT